MPPGPRATTPDVATVRARVAEAFAKVLGGDDPGRALEIAHWNRTIETCLRDGLVQLLDSDPGTRVVAWSDARVRYRYVTRAAGLRLNLAADQGLRARVLASFGDAATDPEARALSPARFVRMTPQEMAPDLWAPVLARTVLREAVRAFDDPATAPDGAYTCGRCKSRKTVYSSLQIRAADEPMTNFVTCLQCRRTWKD